MSESLESSYQFESREEVETKPYSYDMDTISLRTIKTAMPDITEESVIVYPGSAADTGAAEVFGRGVVHIDPDESSISSMQQAGYVGIPSTFEEYLAAMPADQQIDVIYSHNAGLVPAEALARLRQGGYVIANNWHGSANDMGEKPDFELVTAVASGTTETIPADQAQRGLGTYEIAIVRGARMVTDSQEIEAIRNDPGVIITDDNYKNTEAQFLFRKK